MDGNDEEKKDERIEVNETEKRNEKKNEDDKGSKG